jgi:hypothetical protein
MRDVLVIDHRVLTFDSLVGMVELLSALAAVVLVARLRDRPRA